MKASETKILHFIEQSKNFIVPLYQRKYSWKNENCIALWNDVIASGKTLNENDHFIGSIVHISESESNATAYNPKSIIDGQQRLTTVILLIAAIAEFLKNNYEENHEIVRGFSFNQLKDKYLIVPYKTGVEKFRLLLTESDRTTLNGIIEQTVLSDEHSIRVKENFDFFKSEVKNLHEKEKLDSLCNGLAKLTIVDVGLSNGSDDPQRIFASINSTGMPLGQADLIRNYLFMSLNRDVQDSIYESYWRPMENYFGKEGFEYNFEPFMFHFLTARTGKDFNQNMVYVEFQKYAVEMYRDDKKKLFEVLRDSAKYYCYLIDNSPSLKLNEALANLRLLNITVHYPLLLILMEAFSKNKINDSDFICVLNVIESYIFRRRCCGVPTNSLRATFRVCCKVIGGNTNFLIAIKNYFGKLDPNTNTKFPNDAEFKAALITTDLFNNTNLKKYWPAKFENYNNKETINVNNYTMEHIMPQTLTDSWKEMLGSNWKEIHERYLNTLGNLTLTGYNSEYSNRSFIEKKEMEHGFNQSPVVLNHFLKSIDVWNEENIRKRADSLADLAVKIWPMPSNNEIDQDMINIIPVSNFEDN